MHDRVSRAVQSSYDDSDVDSLEILYRLNGRSSAYSPIGSDSRAGHHPAPTADTIIGFVKAWVFLATIIADEC